MAYGGAAGSGGAAICALLMGCFRSAYKRVCERLCALQPLASAYNASSRGAQPAAGYVIGICMVPR